MPIHGYPGGVISATPPTVNSTTASGVWTTEKQLQYQAQGLWPMAVAQPISRSLRFNSADSTHLTRTPASASNQKTWTWSGWCKRSTLSTLQSIFSSRSGSAGCNLQWGEYSTTNDYIIFYSETVNVFVTTPVYRDASAWYHIVLALDTTQATASNRVKLYINGTQVTALTSTSYPSQNADLRINSANQHCIGSTTPSAEFLNGYLTEINFVDGQALTPSSFGQTNSNTGVWEPKAFSGTYGTNGFYLNFSDNSGTTSTTLGKDYSGNGNNWTPNNFSVTAGAGNDSLVDTPTPYGVDTGAGGEVRGNYCTLNPLDLFGTPGVSNGNLSVAGNSGNNFVGSTFPIFSGKWYFEYTNNQATTGSNNTIGLMPRTATSPGNAKTAQDQTYSYAAFVQYAASVTMGDSTTNALARTGTGGGVTDTNLGWKYTANDIVNVAIDFDNKKIWFGKNGTWYNSGVPASGTNATLTINSAVLAMQAYDVGYYAGTWNFGQRAFAYTAPSGFKALCTQNLPTPTVAQGDDYFNTVLYTGNGSTQSITGVGFQPDFVWYKGRSAAYNNRLYDVIRGVTNSLSSNLTDAESAISGVTAFNSDGFSLGSEVGGNNNGTTYVAWNWKANGAGSSNTAGTITSTVSANQTAGFSVLTYTGTGSSGATVGHGLGTAPAMIIVKNRTNSVTLWTVYHQSLGATKYIELNNTNAAGTFNYWNNTAPTSTVFSLYPGGSDNVNKSGSSFVAYCFAAIPGFSAFGSYTGNANADGPFIYTGFRPAFILLKGSGVASNWVILDAKRNTYNVADLILMPDSAGAEGADQYSRTDFLSNGFKLRSSSGAYGFNTVNTYIYAAFAENPFKYALAR